MTMGYSTPTNALPGERQRTILDQLSQKGRVLAADLARMFKTSEDTIRRDLRELAAAGRCRRVYGGALPVSPASGSLAERERLAPSIKQLLGAATARLVSNLLKPGQLLLLDAGSTNLAVARALPPNLRITVATNAPAIAVELLTRPGISVHCIGGPVDPRSGASTGGRALRDLDELRADLAILGACALDLTEGFAAFDADEAEFKRRAAIHAKAVVLAVTADKLGTAAPFHIGPASLISHLVVEVDVPAAQLRRFSKLGVRVHRASGRREKAD